MRNVLFVFLFAIVAIAALLLVQSKPVPEPMPWEITQMPDGKIEVFGIHLGTTSYGEAQALFHEYGRTGIFTQKGKRTSVEAYFTSINLGGLSAKLVLNLAVDEAQIKAMLARAAEARLQPSGAHRYELGNKDNAALINAAITTITYIPSVKLNAEMILNRFGEPSSIEQDPNNATGKIWHYPALGLTIRISEHEKTILQYM